MEFFDVLKERRSARRFKKKGIEEEKLSKITEAANSAPSAGNLQSYEMFVVSGDAKRKELAKACMNQVSVADAPVVLVFCANPERSKRYGERGKTLYCVQDATIAASFAVLAANALGLSCVWVGAFDEGRVAKTVGAPENLRPVAVIPIGYPGETPERTGRRELKDIVHRI